MPPRPSCRKRPPSAQQRRRRDAGERPAVVREVRLVGVAACGGGPRKVLPRTCGAERTRQAQHARQPLGPVSDGRLEAPAQLARADLELGRQRLDASARPCSRNTAARTSGSGGAICGTRAPSAPSRLRTRSSLWSRRSSRRRPSSSQTSWSGMRASRRAAASTPSSAAPAPGRMRTPATRTPAGTLTRNAVVLAPTTCVPSPSVQTMSMQPSGSTRTGAPPSPRRSHAHAIHAASTFGGACSR